MTVPNIKIKRFNVLRPSLGKRLLAIDYKMANDVIIDF